MPRLTNEQMQTELTDAVDAAGGQIEHGALMEQISDQTQRSLGAMIANGVIVRQLRAQPGARASLSYTLPSAAPTPTNPQSEA